MIRFGTGRVLWPAAAALLLAACSYADPPGDPARVMEVLDGDTIVVETGGKRENVRLLGVDTPEMNYKTGEPDPFALEATLFTREKVEGTTVTLTSDPINEDRDRYDRLLRYVHLPGGKLLNLELVRRGYGFAFLRFPLTDRERFVQAEIEARSAGAGLWAPERIRAAPYEDADAFAGRVMAARGAIVAAKTINTKSGDRICFLNFHTDYKRYLSVVIHEADFHRFGDDPASLYEGKTVTVTGRVQEQLGRLQIRVVDPGQIVSSN
jgi:micrococcal nuclease